MSSKWLGHAAPGVTYLSYLRTGDLRQREAVRLMRCDRHLSRSKMAALLSLEDSSYVSKKIQQALGTAKLDLSGCSLTQARYLLNSDPSSLKCCSPSGFGDDVQAH